MSQALWQGKTRTLESALQNRGARRTEYTQRIRAPTVLARQPCLTVLTLDTLEIISLLAVAGLVLHWFNSQERRELTEGYMRALGEEDPERQTQVLQTLADSEEQLSRQFQDLARAFAQLPAPQARTLRLALPGIQKVLPQSTFDTRRVLQVHAEGIDRTVRNVDKLSPRDRAFRLMAEMFLMQHSCHWFCRSRAIASARMLAQHKTRYEQALQAVGPQTREAYLAVVKGPALG